MLLNDYLKVITFIWCSIGVALDIFSMILAWYRTTIWVHNTSKETKGPYPTLWWRNGQYHKFQYFHYMKTLFFSCNKISRDILLVRLDIWIGHLSRLQWIRNIWCLNSDVWDMMFKLNCPIQTSDSNVWFDLRYLCPSLDMVCKLRCLIWDMMSKLRCPLQKSDSEVQFRCPTSDTNVQVRMSTTNVYQTSESEVQFRRLTSDINIQVLKSELDVIIRRPIQMSKLRRVFAQGSQCVRPQSWKRECGLGGP